MKKTRIRVRATVMEVQKGGVFRCQLQDNTAWEVIARLCGKMQKRRIILCVGDAVDVELCPYDLKRGRIVWRH